MKIIKNDSEVRSVPDWFRLAPPAKGEKHWVDGRSAKELAKAWFPAPGEPQVPAELTALLASSRSFGAVTLAQGEPEALVYFDDLGGKPRQCDLLITGTCSLGSVIVSVEAKADEPFGKLAGEELDNLERLLRQARHDEAKTRSHVPERVDRLAAALFGEQRTAVLKIRYQLLYGAAAALSAAAGRAQAAVFVVYEFRGSATNDRKLRQNQADLEQFVGLLTSGSVTAVKEGILIGPITVPGNAHVPGGIPLFIGKAVRRL